MAFEMRGFGYTEGTCRRRGAGGIATSGLLFFVLTCLVFAFIFDSPLVIVTHRAGWLARGGDPKYNGVLHPRTEFFLFLSPLFLFSPLSIAGHRWVGIGVIV